MTIKNTVILGIDIGTSGLRGCLVERNIENANEQVLFQYNQPMPIPQQGTDVDSTVSEQSAATWIDALTTVLDKLSAEADLQKVEHIVCDATSSTVLLANGDNKPLTNALMYNDSQAVKQGKHIERICQQLQIDTAASGASSTLAKALLLNTKLNNGFAGQKPQADEVSAIKIFHQIDVINHYLANFDYITDENNALKLGYDSIKQRWPNWVIELIASDSLPKLQLPKIVAAGTALATIKPVIAERFGLNPKAILHAGTTDSIAGFLASGASQVGDAVSSLGSTMAIKLITDKPVFSSSFGLYSHKLKNAWLVGGASNCGGLSLLHFYHLDTLIALLKIIERQYNETGYKISSNCYPLIKNGERFPIADPHKQPILPSTISAAQTVDKVEVNRILTDIENGVALNHKQQNYINPHINNILQLVNGLVNIESQCYQRLEDISGTGVTRLFSIGGSVQNRIWMQLRKEAFDARGVQLINNDQQPCDSAAFGVTRLIDF